MDNYPIGEECLLNYYKCNKSIGKRQWNDLVTFVFLMQVEEDCPEGLAICLVYHNAYKQIDLENERTHTKDETSSLKVKSFTLIFKY